MMQTLKNILRGPIGTYNYRKFLSSGNPPWKPGYDTHKVNSIVAAINNAAYDPYKLQSGYGWRLDERVVEYPWLLKRLPEGQGRLLDAGSTLNHSYILSHPKLRQKSCFISTLAPEYWAAWQWGVSYVFEDLRDTCFKDEYFDWIACISTIEHVGLDNTMLYTGDAAKNESDTTGFIPCLNELRRVLRPGGTLFLSMPFGQHKNHKWFQIFNSEMVDQVLDAFRPSSHVETIYAYKPEGWIVSDRESAKDATYFDIHTNKNYDEDFAAASRAVVCLELVR